MVSTLHGMIMDKEYLGVNYIIDQWITMQSPLPVLVVTSLYLLFVIKIGPHYMRNRKPYDLSRVLVFYNFIQVLFSIYLWASCTSIISITFKHLTIGGCKGNWMDNFTSHQLANSGWWYTFAKFTELLDTVFFVLRKKTSQITFLHVYHHSVMLVGSWIYLKYAPGESALMVVFLNSIVHTIMYCYYGIAALGPKYTKYIWWKKYMTAIQLVQFILLLGIIGTQLFASQCQLHKAYRYFMFCNTMFFFYLFMDFYRNSYSVDRRGKDKRLETKNITINESVQKKTDLEKETIQQCADSIYKQSYLNKNGRRSMLSNIVENGSTKVLEEEQNLLRNSTLDTKQNFNSETYSYTTSNVYSQYNKENDKSLDGDSTLVMRLK